MEKEDVGQSTNVYPKLHFGVHSQRQNEKLGKLSHQQIELLDSIGGLAWRESMTAIADGKRQVIWKQKLKILREYCEKEDVVQLLQGGSWTVFLATFATECREARETVWWPKWPLGLCW